MKGPLGRRESATVVLLDVTRRYTRLESWLYDRVIAETRTLEDVWYLLFEGELPSLAEREACALLTADARLASLKPAFPFVSELSTLP